MVYDKNKLDLMLGKESNAQVTSVLKRNKEPHSIKVRHIFSTEPINYIYIYIYIYILYIYIYIYYIYTYIYIKFKCASLIAVTSEMSAVF